jgi:hypothetical protein
MAFSSSAPRLARPSGSKVITDPGELGPDLLEALIEALRRLGHAAMVATARVGPLPGDSSRPTVGKVALLIDVAVRCTYSRLPSGISCPPR